MKALTNIGQYLPLDTAVHRLDALIKLLSFVLVVAAVICTDSIIGYAILSLFLLFVAVAARLKARSVLGGIARLWLFFVVIFLMNALFFSKEEPIWSWWIFTLTEKGMAQGGSVVLRVVFVMIANGILMLTTPPMELTDSLQRLLRPIGLIGLPTDDLALIMSAAVQFIPTLLEETESILKAQTARGAGFEGKGLIEKAGNITPLIVPVFISAFKRADELASAMEARGYRGGAQRRRPKKTKVHGRDYLALFIAAALLAIEIIL